MLQVTVERVGDESVRLFFFKQVGEKYFLLKRDFMEVSVNDNHLLDDEGLVLNNDTAQKLINDLHAAGFRPTQKDSKDLLQEKDNRIGDLKDVINKLFQIMAQR